MYIVGVMRWFERFVDIPIRFALILIEKEYKNLNSEFLDQKIKI